MVTSRSAPHVHDAPALADQMRPAFEVIDDHRTDGIWTSDDARPHSHCRRLKWVPSRFKSRSRNTRSLRNGFRNTKNAPSGGACADLARIGRCGGKISTCDLQVMSQRSPNLRAFVTPGPERQHTIDILGRVETESSAAKRRTTDQGYVAGVGTARFTPEAVPTSARPVSIWGIASTNLRV
jgi:hypothetical protein